MSMRGIRGAITVEQNEKEAIWQAAKAMMQELIARNELAPEDIQQAKVQATYVAGKKAYER